MLDREAKEKGVSFEEFRQFCQFLNNLDDFAIAMRMYTLADQAISKGKTDYGISGSSKIYLIEYYFICLDEFSRAVKICTGSTLNPHLIDTVFAIFDEDGDGLLSYKEFIAIMKDRLHRGFKVSQFQYVEDYHDMDNIPTDDIRFIPLMKSRACRRLRNMLVYMNT